MTDPNYSHIIFIVDRSGSMWSTASDATGGIRQFIKDQTLLPGRKTLSLYQFNSQSEQVYCFQPLARAMTYELIPNGGTALYDTIMTAVTKEGEILAAMEEDLRPGKVVVIIVTDGEENSSVEHRGDEGRQHVKELLEQQQTAYSWQVTYIGANVDAFSNAAAMGIPVASAANYNASHTGTRFAFDMASRGTSRYLSGLEGSITYTETERSAAMQDDT